MTQKLNISKEILCPMTGNTCQKLEEEVVEYAAYLARLAQKNSSDIFTNSGNKVPNCCETCKVYEIYGGKCM